MYQSLYGDLALMLPLLFYILVNIINNVIKTSIMNNSKIKTQAEINDTKMREQEMILVENAIARERLGFEESYPKMIKRICYSIVSECGKHLAIFGGKKQNKLHQILSEFN